MVPREQLKPDAAYKQGYSVIPVRPDKKPFFPWKEYQTRRPTVSELTQWGESLKGAGWAAITGKISGIVVLDFDQPHGPETMRSLGLDPHVQTPSGGYHVYFTHPGFEIPTLNGHSKEELGRLFPGLDLRGDGGYVVFNNPTSPYVLLRELAPHPWSSMPDSVRSYMTPKADTLGSTGDPEVVEAGGADTSTLLKRAVDKVAGGEGRNDAGFWLACQLRDHGLIKEDTMRTMNSFRKRCPATNSKGKQEPYTEAEVRATVEQVYSKENRDPWSASPAVLGPATATRAAPITFPDHVITGLAGEFADLYSRHIEASREALFMSFLTCLGSVVGGSVSLDTELAVQPRLFTVILGASGQTRKSTALKAAIGFFKGASLPGFNLCTGVGSSEGLANVVAGIRQGLPPVAAAPVNLLLHADEFKALASKMKIDGSTLLPCLASLYEGNDYENALKASHLKISGINLSLLAASTTGTYEVLFDPSMLDLGLLNRLFIVPVEGERRFAIPRPVDPTARATLQGKLVNLVTSVIKDRPKLAITPEALDIFEKWYLALPDSELATRLDTIALRLMCLLAINSGKLVVDEEIVRIVIDLCVWQFKVRRAFAPIDAINTGARLEESIRRALQKYGSLPLGKLKNRVHSERYGLRTFDTALGNLITAGEVVKSSVGQYSLGISW
ncbi:bifunctional DNA primase/polymerase [uncultured Sphaerochaeta sp.]|mgnify:CR=1 FL=1|uniref:bifunctional DNA primase/polymerase n=1 Tax=uncultured Sphaerochaeta sp. TaxID=886478 RepID=UPI002621BAD2|nr:bifunctional DNA primase/polymerase [uncultured Sphaerochaeta sp.]